MPDASFVYKKLTSDAKKNNKRAKKYEDEFSLKLFIDQFEIIQKGNMTLYEMGILWFL